MAYKTFVVCLLTFFGTSVIWGQPPNKKYQTRHALLVGISAYSGSELVAVENAATEVERLGRFLEEKAGFDQVVVLKDSAASYRGIQLAFQDFIKTVGSEDLFLFYFSGRGTRLPDDLFPDELDDFDECLLPSDAEAESGYNVLRDDEIGRFLQRLPAPNPIVVVDAAYEGGTSEDKGFTAVEPMAGQRYDGISRQGNTGGDFLPAGTLVIETTAADTTVLAGQFAPVFLSALTGAADASEDGIVSVFEVHGYLVNKLGFTAWEQERLQYAQQVLVVQPLLEVKVNRPATTVLIDGDSLGMAPGKFPLSLGRHVFSVHKSGYEVYPEIAPVIDLSAAVLTVQLVRLRATENRFFIRLQDTIGRPLSQMITMINNTVVGVSDQQGYLEAQMTLAPDMIQRLSLHQLGVQLTPENLLIKPLEDPAYKGFSYELTAQVDISPVTLVLVDAQGTPLSGFTLVVKEQNIGTTDELGQVRFGERLIGGRAALANLELEAIRFGRRQRLDSEKIQRRSEVEAEAVLDVAMGHIELRPCVGAIDVGGVGDFAGQAFLETEEKKYLLGADLPLVIQQVFPALYGFTVQQQQAGSFSDSVRVVAAKGSKVCVPVGAGIAWAQTLELMRDSAAGVDPAVLDTALELARAIGREDMVGVLQGWRGLE